MMKRKKTVGSQLAQISINVIIFALCLTCLVPIIAIIAISFSTEADIINYGYRLIPKELSFSAFELVFKDPKSILNGYGVSFFVTIVGSALGLAVCSMVAYPLTRESFAYRKPLSFYMTFTVLFSGGMIPTYILMTEYLGLKNSVWALILPNVANVWHVFLLRTFFAAIPTSLIEAAKLDGAGEFKIFYSIILPLSKTGLATVLLFYVLIYWNDWYGSMLYITDENKLALQYLLVRLMNNIDYVRKNAAMLAGVNMADMPKESARMAMCLVAAGPMLVAFPFFQKYFVKGLTVGAVKG